MWAHVQARITQGRPYRAGSRAAFLRNAVSAQNPQRPGPQKLHPEACAESLCVAHQKFGSMHSIFASRFKIIKNIFLDNVW